VELNGTADSPDTGLNGFIAKTWSFDSGHAPPPLGPNLHQLGWTKLRLSSSPQFK
jgi:hypothetical protein